MTSDSNKGRTMTSRWGRVDVYLCDASVRLLLKGLVLEMHKMPGQSPDNLVSVWQRPMLRCSFGDLLLTPDARGNGFLDPYFSAEFLVMKCI